MENDPSSFLLVQVDVSILHVPIQESFQEVTAR